MKRFSSILAFLLISVVFAVPAPAQTGEIVPGDNLMVEGIPKIPASLAEAVGRYTEFRAASLSSWHPTRREMLIATRFGDTQQVHLVKFPGGRAPSSPFSSTAWAVLPTARSRETSSSSTRMSGATDRKSTRLNSSHIQKSRMPSSA